MPRCRVTCCSRPCMPCRAQVHCPSLHLDLERHLAVAKAKWHTTWTSVSHLQGVTPIKSWQAI